MTVTGGSYIICEGGHFYILGGQVTVGGTLEVEEYLALDGEGNPYAAVNARQTGFDAQSGTLYLYFKDATADSDDNLLKAGTSGPAAPTSPPTSPSRA